MAISGSKKSRELRPAAVAYQRASLERTLSTIARSGQLTVKTKVVQRKLAPRK